MSDDQLLVEQPETEEADELEEEVTPYKYEITSYGADYPVDGLVKRMVKGDIVIPEFQRSFVWSHTRSYQFIESLLLGLPVPGIFLYREPGTQRLVIIDGQQRLKTLLHFYRGVWENGAACRLNKVQPEFEGMKYDDLPEEDRRRLDDSIIHATIINQDQPSDDDSSIYFVFHRLNTGGMTLSPQEIRACIYHGPFDGFLGDLNEDQAWRDLYGKVNLRKKDEELILRFLAFRFALDTYRKPMNIYLNRFMRKYRHLPPVVEGKFGPAFRRVTQALADGIGWRTFRPVGRLNAAFAEAIMVGLSESLDAAPDAHFPNLGEIVQSLAENQQFMTACISGTTDEQSVSTRLDLARKAFLGG